MWVLVGTAAFAQTITNPDFDGPTPTAIPNDPALAADNWTFDSGVDLGVVNIPFHCSDILLNDSLNSGSFARILSFQPIVGPVVSLSVSTEVTNLTVGVPYKIYFEQSIVRHLGQSTGQFEIEIDGAVFTGPTLALPAGNPEQGPWESAEVGPFVASALSATLVFSAVTNDDGANTPSPELPNDAEGCTEPSDLTAADLLLDGVVLVGDHDLDTLYDDEENLIGTDPFDADSDDDGIDDGVEVGLGFDPLDEDMDDDGLFDGIEDDNADGIVDPGETDPNNADTDGDTLLDGAEDANADGIVDPGETDPLNSDTDGDTLSDGDEVNTHGTDPTLADTDGEGLLDGDEINNIGTDPLLADTDGDTISDYDEVQAGTDPLDANDPPVGTTGDTGTVTDGTDTVTDGTDTPTDNTDGPTVDTSGDTGEPKADDPSEIPGCECNASSSRSGVAWFGIAALLVAMRRRLGA